MPRLLEAEEPPRNLEETDADYMYEQSITEPVGVSPSTTYDAGSAMQSMIVFLP
jgi:hypothetical protein